jgi:6-phosphogluconolactonase (cycloisomerase 2 family)
MTSRLCLMIVSAAILVPLVGCSDGSSGSMGGGNPNPRGNAVPTISSVTPPNADAGGGPVTITVTGTGFVSTSTALWNDTKLMTSEMSDTSLTATIPAADIALAGAAQITVVNPAPGGGTSNPVGFVIINGTQAATSPGFLYVANSKGDSPFPGNISAFSVDPNTGVLTPVPGSPPQVGPVPFALTADPSSRFLYVSTFPTSIYGFTINPTTGALTQVPGPPSTTGTVEGAISLAVDSTDKFLYTADNAPSPNNVSEFSIDAATGALTPLSQEDCTDANGGVFAGGVVTDPTAPFAFVVSAPAFGLVCSFSIEAGGSLQPVPGSPVFLPTTPLTSPNAIAIDAFGKFIFTVNEVLGSLSAPVTSSVSVFIIAAGSLMPAPGSPFAAELGENGIPALLATDTLDRFLYAANTNQIAGYSINTSTGALSPLGGFPFNVQNLGSNGINSLVVDPSGKFLYVTGENPIGDQDILGSFILAYAIDQTTGALTPVPSSPFPDLDGTPANGAMMITRKIQ